MNFRILGVVLFAIITMVSCNNSRNEKDVSLNQNPDVVIAYEKWSENKAFAMFAKNLLEENGFVVKTLLVEDGYNAVLKGRADLFLDRWEPTDFYPESTDKLLPLGNVYETTYVALVVPDYMNISSIADLEKNKSKLQNRIYAVNPESESFIGLNVAYQRYSLTLNIEEVSEAELIHLFETKYNKKEPFCFAGWFPHPMLNTNKLRILEDPYLAFYQKYNPTKYCSRTWAKSHPKLVSVFTKFSFSESQFKVLIDKAEQHNTDIDKASLAWYKELSSEFKKIFE